jgi:hypothetical protein
MNNIISNFKTPGHPLAFSTSSRIKKFYPNFSKSKINNELEKLNAYTRHRQKKKPSYFNPFFMYKKRQQIQADLIDMQKLSAWNNGVKYILVMIDCFTKKAAVAGLKNKTMDTTLNAVDHILTSTLSPLTNSIVFDEGTEFNNAKMNQYLISHNIKSFNPKGEHKAAFAERFNRTLQSLIYQYMTHYNTNKYIDVLQKLVATYNNRFHRSIKMTPNQAENSKNHHLVRQAMELKYGNILQHKKSPELSKGDIVRVKMWKHPFSRGYTHQFTKELFKVIDINTKMPIPMYTIQSFIEPDPIRGSFYAQELQKYIPV